MRTVPNEYGGRDIVLKGNEVYVFCVLQCLTLIGFVTGIWNLAQYEHDKAIYGEHVEMKI